MEDGYFEEFDDIISQLDGDMRGVWNLLERYRGDPDSVLDTLAAHSWRELRFHREAAASALLDSSSNVRMSALLLHIDYWELTQESADICEQIVFQDSSADARGLALYVLIPSNFKSDRMTRLLAGIIAFQGDKPRLGLLRPNLSLRKRIDDSWNKLFGALVEPGLMNSMIRDAHVAEKGLDDDDVNVRTGALCVIGRYWRECARLADKCVELINCDNEEKVRASAVSVLSSLISSRDNEKIGVFLAGLVRDCHQPLSIRSNAYEGLFRIRKVKTVLRLAIKRIRGQFDFPADVDWSFVDSFLD